ncbi:hypothetical protein PoB_005507400 [Plakobranchus ocellatus]|uniref:Uncharacterized protein n=1 Tax=Plakobranchus ocellatus TaxID=259542 RepID=A0AAV4CBT8_9GAST|nr:hypothetical protein PoB_005507400 [Plakobranchus ocellatus]
MKSDNSNQSYQESASQKRLRWFREIQMSFCYESSFLRVMFGSYSPRSLNCFCLVLFFSKKSICGFIGNVRSDRLRLIFDGSDREKDFSVSVSQTKTEVLDQLAHQITLISHGQATPRSQDLKR